MTGASDVELAAYLGDPEAQALRAWQLATGRFVQIPARRWSSAGYTEATLHSIVVAGGVGSTHCIVKSSPAEPDGASGSKVDREPVRPLFHDLAGAVRAAELKGLPTRDKVPFVLSILDAPRLSAFRTTNSHSA